MKKLLFFIFLLFYFCGFSQQGSNITIKGLVTNANNKPITYANISIIGSSKGTKTNKNGIFYLTVQQNATTLKISHIGYYTKNKILAGNTINDTLHITIHLTQKINQLETFEISAEKIELLYNKNFVPIYDYQFYEDKLLLLVKKLNVIKLRLTDNNQKVLKELVMPHNTKEIYVDCFDNIHVLNKDSAYQIEIDKEKMSIIYRVPINQFNTFLRPCVIQFRNTLIFKQKNESKDIAYYYLDKNKKVHYLKIVRDDVAKRYISRIEEVKREIDRLQYSDIGNNRGVFHKLRSLNQDLNFLNHIFKKIKESPLILIKGTVYIFDYPDNTCWVFDENLELIKGIPIDYHLQKNWSKQLLIDKEQGEVYAKFEKGGFVYLKKIDLQTGTIINTYKLEKHTFPTNIKIRNNTAYYLYQNHSNHGQMSLFKQGLY